MSKSKSKINQTPESNYSRKCSFRTDSKKPLQLIVANEFFDQDFKDQRRLDYNTCKLGKENRIVIQNSPFASKNTRDFQSANNQGSSSKKLNYFLRYGGNNSQFNYHRNQEILNDISSNSILARKWFSSTKGSHNQIQISPFENIRNLLKQFRLQNDQNQEYLSDTQSRMKRYCQENEDCFDFYHLNDPILLKYLIFLLYQELEKEVKINQNEENLHKQKMKVYLSDSTNEEGKKVINDAAKIIQSIISELKKMDFANFATSSQKIIFESFENLQSQIQKFKPGSPIQKEKSFQQFQQIFQNALDSSDQSNYQNVKKYISLIEMEFKKLDKSKSDLIFEKSELEEKLKIVNHQSVSKLVEEQLKSYLNMLKVSYSYKSLKQSLIEQQQNIHQECHQEIQRQTQLIQKLQKDNQSQFQELVMDQQAQELLTQRINDINSILDKILQDNQELQIEKNRLVEEKCQKEQFQMINKDLIHQKQKLQQELEIKNKQINQTQYSLRQLENTQNDLEQQFKELVAENSRLKKEKQKDQDSLKKKQSQQLLELFKIMVQALYIQSIFNRLLYLIQNNLVEEAQYLGLIGLQLCDPRNQHISNCQTKKALIQKKLDTLSDIASNLKIQSQDTTLDISSVQECGDQQLEKIFENMELQKRKLQTFTIDNSLYSEDLLQLVLIQCQAVEKLILQ